MPSWDQAHLSRLRSKLCWCPASTFMQRLAGAKGRRSHTRRELSCQAQEPCCWSLPCLPSGRLLPSASLC